MSVFPLISAAQAVLTGLIPLATEQIKRAVFDFQDDLTSLHRRLTMIQALLRDAENNRRVSSEVLKLWLKHLKLATCDAENVLDEIGYEALRTKLEARTRDKVRNLFSLSNPLAFRPKIANKVKKVDSLLHKICQDATDMGLRPTDQLINATTTVEPSEWRLTHPFVDDSKIVGREGDVSAVKEMLLGSDMEDDTSVVAIVGMGGLGKTTVAQLVYKSKEVVTNFDRRMWICVSDDFRDTRILNEMVQSLTGEKSEIPNIEGMVKKLGEILNGKKYLLTLDDVWNTSESKWESLRTALLGIGGSKGRKILVTTRSMDVVSTMRASRSLTHRLGELSRDDSWAMFRKRAFANGGPRETQTLVGIGKRVVEKCKGVPLAINSLGGLLYSKQLETEWESIEKSKMWGTLGDENGILPILRLSFDHLPSPSLKQCFIYCSIFGKDEVIIKDVLIQLWMGLGYLQPCSGSNLEMEDVGNEYFNILSRSSLFQEVKLDQYNNVTTCKMHDLVHDLALDLSEGSCLTLKASEVRDHPDVQHLSLRLPSRRRVEISKENVGKLRTLFSIGYFPGDTKGIECVRALSLEDDAEELQSPLRKFVQLRYLHFSSIRTAKLPNFITRLYNLQTLRLHPSANLNQIPEELHKLVSLRHFCIADTENNRKLMPKMVGHLTSLLTLPFFVVNEDRGHTIEELGSLTKLRGRLHVYDLQHVKDMEEAQKAQLLTKSGITELGFHWDGGFGNSDINHENVLEGLKPHTNLRELMIENFGGRRIASWMRSRDACLLQNLMKIELRYCRLCEQVPALGYLPHLEVVIMHGLDNLKRIGPEFYGLDEGIGCTSSSSNSGAGGGGVFQALRKIIFSSMLGLEEWSDISSCPAAATSKKEFFPCLEKIYIHRCPQLITIPPLGRIPHLEIVEMDGLDNLKHIGPEFYGLDEGVVRDSRSGGEGEGGGVVFPALRELSLSNMRKLEAWSDLSSLPIAATSIATSMKEFFPCLEKLCIRNCPQLLILGSMVPIQNVSALSVDASYGDFEMRYNSFGVTIVVDPDSTIIVIWLEDFLEKSSKSLQYLTVRGLNKLLHFPNQLLNLASLARLEICNCSNLISLPYPDTSLLPSTASSTKKFFPHLHTTHIWNCPQLIKLPSYMLCVHSLAILSADASYGDTGMEYSSSLTLGVDPDLKNIDILMDYLLENVSECLRNLKIKGLNELYYFPNRLLNLSSLERLDICDCSNLMYIIEETEAAILNGLTSLKQLLILRCCKLRCLTKGLLRSLVTLEIIWCPFLASQDELRNLASLQNLTIGGCPKWVSWWEEGLHGLTSLQKLEIGKFSEDLECFPWPTTSVEFLESLSLWGWPKCKDLPDRLHNGLRELEIYSFDGLEALPEWLGNISSLQSLRLNCCKNLMRLPSLKAIQRLTNFKSLSIESCPLLWARCLKGKSEEWQKIGHIQHIKFKKWYYFLHLPNSLSLSLSRKDFPYMCHCPWA